MSRVLCLFAGIVGVLASGTAFSQPGSYSGMPPNAKILEVRVLPPPSRPNRAFVLWMADPQAFPRHNEHQVRPDDEPDVYTCPEVTRGWFYRGPTRVSLVDTSQSRILNTVEIKVPLTNGWQDELTSRIGFSRSTTVLIRRSSLARASRPSWI